MPCVKANGKRMTSSMTEYEKVVGRTRKLEVFLDERLSIAEKAYGLAKSEMARAEREAQMAAQNVAIAQVELQRIKQKMKQR